MAFVSIRIVLPPACRNQTPNPPSETSTSPTRAPRAGKGRGEIRRGMGECGDLRGNPVSSPLDRFASDRRGFGIRSPSLRKGEEEKEIKETLRASPNMRLITYTSVVKLTRGPGSGSKGVGAHRQREERVMAGRCRPSVRRGDVARFDRTVGVDATRRELVLVLVLSFSFRRGDFLHRRQ